MQSSFWAKCNHNGDHKIDEPMKNIARAKGLGYKIELKQIFPSGVTRKMLRANWMLNQQRLDCPGCHGPMNIVRISNLHNEE